MKENKYCTIILKALSEIENMWEHKKYELKKLQ